MVGLGSFVSPYIVLFVSIRIISTRSIRSIRSREISRLITSDMNYRLNYRLDEVDAVCNPFAALGR